MNTVTAVEMVDGSYQWDCYYCQEGDTLEPDDVTDRSFEACCEHCDGAYTVILPPAAQ